MNFPQQMHITCSIHAVDTMEMLDGIDKLKKKLLDTAMNPDRPITHDREPISLSLTLGGGRKGRGYLELDVEFYDDNH